MVIRILAISTINLPVYAVISLLLYPYYLYIVYRFLQFMWDDTKETREGLVRAVKHMVVYIVLYYIKDMYFTGEFIKVSLGLVNKEGDII